MNYYAQRDHIIDKFCEFRSAIRRFVREHQRSWDQPAVQAAFHKVLDDWDLILSGVGVPTK